MDTTQTYPIFEFTHKQFLFMVKEGWGIFHPDTTPEHQQIQRLDNPERWKEDFDLPFTPATLDSDKEAYEKASKYFTLDENGYVLAQHTPVPFLI